MAVDGLSNKQIAHQLRISPRTVTDHITNASEKLGAMNRTHLGVLAVRQRLVWPANSWLRSRPRRGPVAWDWRWAVCPGSQRHPSRFL